MIRSISFVFTLNPEHIPYYVGAMAVGAREVYAHPTGRPIITEPKESCSLYSFLLERLKEGYRLVSAGYEQHRSGADKKTYHIARYAICSKEFATLSKKFLKKYDALLEEFIALVDDNAFTIRRADLNSVVVNHITVPGHFALEVNLNGRQPLVDGDGLPLLVWDRPRNVMGAAKVPMRAKHEVKLTEDGIIIVAN